MRNVNYKFSFLVMIIICLLSTGLIFAAQSSQQAPAAKQTTSATAGTTKSASEAAVSQIVDKIVARETAMAETMKTMHPLVETYIQNLDKDDDLAFRPAGDQYFLGKLDFNPSRIKERTFLDEQAMSTSILGRIKQMYSVKYLPEGFEQMLVVGGHFDQNSYNFEYVRREFLGAVRCLVFDVMPKKGGSGTFKGRIWVEDQDYNIVRFNGTYGPSTMTKMFFHFDSWREYLGTGMWLPAYVYTEESNMSYLAGRRHLRFKGQTRLWGYNVGKSNAQNELTALTVESDQVKDTVDEAEGMSPVRALRAWERQAEDNIIQRFEKAGLIAPDGEVNKILETVITNLEVTNNLDIQPEVRARVLLTSPLESFTIGHTVVISRGLLDVLPDEASLAMILARELAHIALGHRLDTMYAFSDRMLFEDPEAFHRVDLKRDGKEEADADAKAEEFLKNSPYKDKLGNAGLFLKAVDQRAATLTHLLAPHMGNTMIKGHEVFRMADLKETAPKLEMTKVDQIAALPLGGRVRVDPWSAKAELMKSKPVALLSAREKMPFEVTPIYLYLTRQTAAPQTAATEPTKTSGVKQ
jgi:Peptidase family M48